ncbi:MAG: MarR family transcriptional regulator [Myxococcales bacterium]|nr:MarR family transcriptional regulator [Myxococcales bacterium]
MQEVLTTGRELSTAVVMFHTVLAAKQDLNASETKALDLLQRAGSLTAGELSEQSGLAPASITGLVNRLEAKGFVRRLPDPDDGRRVRIATVPERLAETMHLFADLVTELEALCDEFTVQELAVIARFMREAARRQEAAGRRLAADP